jgi:hypothetical protein
LSVYVDSLFTMQSREKVAFRVGSRHGHRWCHMFADTEAELLEMAKKIWMRPQWIQRTSLVHFDLVPPRRAKAVKLGAIEVDRKQYLEIRKRLRSAA